MRISVFGLGYVGCVSAACLANDGHTVIGVDVDSRKVASINEGRAPFAEPGLEPILNEARSRGSLKATVDEFEAIAGSDLALVCVGTPSARTGEILLDALRTVLFTIGMALRDRETPFVVVLRSTVFSHVVEGEMIPLLERAAGKKLGNLLQFCYNPEFLREGTAIRDFYEAPMVVVGHNGSWAAELVAELYSKVDAPIIYTDIGTASMVKYVCNVFHALKVSFANEIGLLSESMHVDGRKVMEIVCMDTKLNISPMYLKPGFAFGGSCLPKDLRAMMAESRLRGLPLPVIQGILPSNQGHLKSCADSILRLGERSIGLFGLTFKEDTDDLRESPAVELAETLIGKGMDLKIYEPNISHDSIHGTNLAYIERTIPHIWKLLTKSLEEMARKSKVIVLLKKVNGTDRLIIQGLREDQVVIDYVNTIAPAETAARIITFASPTEKLVLQ
jgi:GDP-mannose 6-dehydrogenase